MRVIGMWLVLASCMFLSAVTSPVDGDVDVIVVGGGLAGVAAAQRLHKANLKVKLLEARDRLGGRVRTERTGLNSSTRVEMGAQFIHGGMEANPIFNLAIREKLIKEPFIKIEEEEDFAGYFLYPEGHVVSTNYQELALSMLGDLRDGDFLTDFDFTKLSRFTLKEIIDLKVASNLNNSQITPEEKEIVSDVINTLMVDFTTLMGSDLEEIGLELDGEGSLPGGDILVPSGLDSIINHLANDLQEAGAVHLNAVVNEINWDEEGRVLVTTENGETHSAAHVIVALPLGVLKNKPDLIKPSLSPPKMRAINSMNTGKLSKVWLEWENPWWTNEHSTLHLVWPQQERTELDDWTTSMVVVIKIAVTPNMLLFFIPAEAADQVDNLEDDILMAKMMETLRYFTGDSELPDPIAVHRHAWTTDPFTQGAYSTPSPTTQAADHASLLSPEGGDNLSVLLAGEYTHSRFMATMHGAYLSGLMQANTIIESKMA